jgi:hypothetical protein
MKINIISFSDVKTIHGFIFNSEEEVSSVPLPGATCSVIAGATTTCCTSCSFAA